MLADNQLALNAGWDGNLLRIEIAEIGLAVLEVPIMGISDEFLSDLFKTNDGKTETDDIPQPEAVAALSRAKCGSQESTRLGAR